MSFMKDFDHLKIQMKDILSATNNFDPAKVIGRGGFGNVYKGELSLPNGQIKLAFKQLDRRRGQGSVEFWKEVMMLSKYKHENLITLLYFCIDGDQMVLVYEHASRGSLDRYLNDPITLPWIRRLKVLVGAARGVQFLHDPKNTHQRVLHRDIKSANILLDENWTAKVSDFGLSKLGPANQGHSYLISHSVGTPGYCDPLYMEFGFLSKESDVYSFGVVLFENLCGRLCYEYHNHELSNILVPKWRQCYKENKLDEIILPGLKEQMDRGSLRSFAAIAYQCVKKAREERPTLADIVEALEFSLKQQEILENMGEKMDPSVDNNDDSPKIVDKFEIFTLNDQNFQDQAHDDYSQPPLVSDGEGSCGSDSEEDRPGIEEFQIIGDAKLGGKLLACGYPVRGTSLLMFQWVRLLQDGLMEYVEGATDPGYVVTADDVDKLIAVECIPMNDRGQQGELVLLFANQQNRITCDPEMQQKLDDYISAGRASFNVLLLMDSFESGEQTTFSLRQYGYTIMINRTQDIIIREEYSTYFPSIVLSVDAPRFVLNRLNGPSHTFAFDDVRTRDTFVLTMRMFQRTSLLPHKLEDRPGIEEFQIIGDAKLGGKLLACGFPVRGTSLCKLQWVRFRQDGAREYIEGATKPEYVVTADDVDNLIYVECTPISDRGQRGELVQLFANQQNRITCDPEMQRKLDDYVSAGQASFSVLLLVKDKMDSSKSWEQTTFSLRQYEYKIKINRTHDIFIHEKYASYLPSIVLFAEAPQIVLKCLNWSSHTFAFDDIRTRDTFVLTMRMFQRRSLLPHELEDLPGMEEFQIIGDAKLGGKLLACGFPVRGTSLCKFQWVRFRQDGAREYIEGATKPEYVVTADDVDNLIYVECTPISDRGQRGELVQLFANQQNRITCDPEMQRKLDDYVSAGQASFSVLLLVKDKMDFSKSWEQTTFSLRQYEYKIKINRTHDIFIHEKYASYLPSIVLFADAPQIVLKCLNWSSHTFAFDDIRTRDTFVLTMRMFQRRSLLPHELEDRPGIEEF